MLDAVYMSGFRYKLADVMHMRTMPVRFVLRTATLPLDIGRRPKVHPAQPEFGHSGRTAKTGDVAVPVVPRASYPSCNTRFFKNSTAAYEDAQGCARTFGTCASVRSRKSKMYAEEAEEAESRGRGARGESTLIPTPR